MRRIDLAPFEIQIFLEVAECRSFRAAADRCQLSQPAVSRAVSRIESRLGTRLFDRTSRFVSLTPQGKAFLPIAKRIVRDLTTSLDELGSYCSGNEGHVVVAALPSVAASFLPEAIRDVMRDHPGVTVSIVDTLLEGVAAAVAQGDVDFGLAVEPAPGSSPVMFEPVVSDRFVAVLRSDHDLARREELSWADFESNPFVAMAGTTSVRALTDAAFRSARLTVSPAFEVSHLASAVALVAAGLGITALPELTLNAVRQDDLVARPLRDPVRERTIGILLRANRTLSPAAEILKARLAGSRPVRR